MTGKPIDEAALDRACEAYAEIADDCMGLVRRRAMREALIAAQQVQAVELAPRSAPVGVEAIAAEIRASLGRGATVCTRRRWAIELEALAQQPAAVDEAAAIRAFEEHFQASSDDPYFEGELELWLTAWRKALADQRGGRTDG